MVRFPPLPPGKHRRRWSRKRQFVFCLALAQLLPHAVLAVEFLLCDFTCRICAVRVGPDFHLPGAPFFQAGSVAYEVVVVIRLLLLFITCWLCGVCRSEREHGGTDCDARGYGAAAWSDACGAFSSRHRPTHYGHALLVNAHRAAFTLIACRCLAVYATNGRADCLLRFVGSVCIPRTSADHPLM